MSKRPGLWVTVIGIICLTVIFVVNSFTLKVDNYFAIGIVGIIAWLIGVPMGWLFKKK